MKDKHTGGEWKIEEDAETKCKTIIRSDEQLWDIASTQSSTLEGDIVEIEANAERIVTCVNALDGISDDALKSGIVREMAQHYRKLLWRVNKVTSAHRHGVEMSDRALTELSNYQLDCESILSKLEDKHGYNI